MEKEQHMATLLDDGNSSDSGLEILSDNSDVEKESEKKEPGIKVPSRISNKRKSHTKSKKYKPKAIPNNQGSSLNQDDKEEKSSQPSKQQGQESKPRKTRPKKEFADEQRKQRNPKNQRQQQKPEPTKAVSKQQPAKQAQKQDQTIRYEQEWTVNNIIGSDNQDNEKYLKEEGEGQFNENQQLNAFVEEQEIQNLTTIHENNELNNAYIDKEVSLKYEHWVENKHLLVLYLLFRKQIYDQFPRKHFNRIDIHPSNKNKIRIFGTSNQEIKEVSAKISELVNKIAIVKLNIRNDEATRLKSSKLLNDRLLKDKMVIFRYGNNGQKSYYLGGKGSQPQLSAVFKDIRNLKFRYFRMFDYKNTRSYSIILGHIIRQKELLKAFLKWSVKHIEIVPFIPTFNHGPKKDKERSLCFLMTTVGTVQNFSPKEIQLTMAPFIKNTFYSIALIFKKGEPYLPKLQVDGVFFKYVFERKFAWAYVYIICTKKEFFAKRNEIISEIEKLAEKNIIFGTRYFDNIAPERSEYIRPDIYKEIPYPENEPYSSSIIARRFGSEESENKKEEKKEEGSEMKEKEERAWYKFDWKEHLMNIKPSEIPVKEEIKK